jgi:aminopeptidase N
MKTDQLKRKLLADYQPSDFDIRTTRLEFNLDEISTRVKSELLIVRSSTGKGKSLCLDGIALELVDIAIDGNSLKSDEYVKTDENITILEVPDSFTLNCEVIINPKENTRLEGLYLSNGVFCTQCEAEGFRYITYYIDRPDVMSVFTVKISSNHALSAMLSNGNRIDQQLDGSQKTVSWEDPFPKPSYLFALVAGNLACVEDNFTTQSGRKVGLKIYTEHHNRHKCDHAMLSLQKAMRWDEEVFGLEYDLDLYMVVAVDDFNMGAMENKGLNVFNTKYVLANSKTATDNDYLGIESVIAHEYFHNWTGNRVTCRDWFQLSLKEGLTVFRDQQFSADMTSKAIQRINDVRVLRNHQFPEDAGPMAHPVRPTFYQEINNFYTATVYNKGAEVVRMMYSLLGVENFRKGMDLYFERHDGQAVTTDDFRQAMADASGIDLTLFQRWYQQSGTPQVSVKRVQDSSTGDLMLQISQQPGSTKGDENLPFQLPMRLALFDSEGHPIALNVEQEYEVMIDITDTEQSIRFPGISSNALVSAFRHFSAPVKLELDLSDQELATLMTCDTDAFNRWDAGQQLACRVLLTMIDSDRALWSSHAIPVVKACARLIKEFSQEADLCAEMLVLPSEKYLAEFLTEVDVHKIRNAREFLKFEIAAETKSDLAACYKRLENNADYQIDTTSMANRRLRNICLNYLLCLEKDEYFELCLSQFENADNMTDQMACFAGIIHYPGAIKDQIVEAFYSQWSETALVVDKWFSVQGGSYGAGALNNIIVLFDHSAYSLKNPNRARSLLGGLIGNSSAFHQIDGAGYRFVADKLLELDQINPQVAARMANAFLNWRKLTPGLSQKVRSEMQRMLEQGGLSNDLNELLNTALSESE